MNFSSLKQIRRKTSRIFQRSRSYHVTTIIQDSPSLSTRSSLWSKAEDSPEDLRYGEGPRNKPERKMNANLPNAPIMIDKMMSLSKLETFKHNYLEDGQRFKERLLRSDVYMDPRLKTHVKGQIMQLELRKDKRCRFPNMQDVMYVVLQDMIDYGNDSRLRGGIVGETHNTRIVSKAFLPVYGFDTKSVTFWFRHQKVFRKIVCDELEELVMINRYIQMRADWIDHHDPFWHLSDQAMSALNVLAFLIYSLDVPVPQVTYAVPLPEPLDDMH